MNDNKTDLEESVKHEEMYGEGGYSFPMSSVVSLPYNVSDNLDFEKQKLLIQRDIDKAINFLKRYDSSELSV